MVQIHPDPPVGCSFFDGAVAQLGERLPCTQEVRSSILLGSTTRLADDAGRAVCRNKCFDVMVRLKPFFLITGSELLFNNLDEIEHRISSLIISERRVQSDSDFKRYPVCR